MHTLIPRRSKQTGDTLIEVLVAIAVLGAIITISYAVMSRGFASGQNSLDRTGTQALLSGQAASLRAAHARAVNDDTRFWSAITQNVVTNPSGDLEVTKLADGCATSLVGNAKMKTFYFNPSATYDSANPLATGPLAPVSYYLAPPTDDSKLIRQGGAPALGDGIWIEGYKDANNFYTFYIKSCWWPTYGDGSNAMRQAKTVVRLYYAP